MRYKDTVHRGEIHGQRNGMWCNIQDELALHHLERFEEVTSTQQKTSQTRTATATSRSAPNASRQPSLKRIHIQRHRRQG